MRNARFRGLAAGDQLGNLEYLIDDDVMDKYRALIGDCGNYANLIADDCESMAATRFGITELNTVWRRFDFLRPPIPGLRIQAGGWLKEIRKRDGSPWLRVSAFAVDEIGTEILRSRHVFRRASGRTPERLGRTPARRRSFPSR